MKNNVIIDGITFSFKTARLIREDGMSPAEDVAAFISGEQTPEELLATYLLYDPDSSDGWIDYVSAVAIAAGVA